MKHTSNLGFLCATIITSVLLLLATVSCGSKIEPPKSKKLHIYEDYPSLSKGIDSLLMQPAWDADFFDQILLSIYTNNQYKRITPSETHTCYAKVFRGSCSYMREHIEKLMKSPDYKDLNSWESVANSVQDKLAEYFTIDSALEIPDPDLTVVFEMICEYRKVEELSKSTFVKKVRCVEPYSIDYSKTEEKIKKNKYWSSYFSNNTEICESIAKFPQRLQRSRTEYYKSLKDEIKMKATLEKVSEVVLEQAVDKFKGFTNNNNDQVKEDISGFVLNYKEENPTSNDNLSDFWR